LRRGEARHGTLDRFMAPSQERLWALARTLWSWDHDSVGLFLDSHPGVAGRTESHTRFAAGEVLLRESWRHAPPNWLHSRDQLCLQRLLEYQEAEANLGRRGMRAFCGRVRGAYFQRNLACNESLPLFRRLGVLAGDHIQERFPISIFRWSEWRLLLGQGIRFARRLTAMAGNTEEYLETDVNQLPMETAIGKTATRVGGRSTPEPAIVQKSGA